MPVSAQPGAAKGRAGGSGGAQRRGGRGRALRFPRFPPPAAPRERGGGGGTGRERSSELTALSTGKRIGRGAGPGGGTEPTPQGAARAVPRRRRFPPVPRAVPSVQLSPMRSAPIGPSPALPASVRSGSIPSDAANPGAAHPGSTGLASPRPSLPAPSRHTPGARRYLRGSARCRRSVRPGARALSPRPSPSDITARGGTGSTCGGGAQRRGGVRSSPLPAGLAPVPRSREPLPLYLKSAGGLAGRLGPEGGAERSGKG